MSTDILKPTYTTTIANVSGSIEIVRKPDSVDRALLYSNLPDGVADEALRIVNRVRARHESQIEAVVETGRDLAMIKGELSWRFSYWLDTEFGSSVRTAQKYMAVAATFGGKTAIVADLPMTTVYSLSALSTPEPVRTEIVQRLASGDRVGADEIKGLIADGKKQAKAEQIAAKLTPAQRARREQMAEETEVRRRALEYLAELLVEVAGDDPDDVVTLLEQARETALLQAVRALLGAARPSGAGEGEPALSA